MGNYLRGLTDQDDPDSAVAIEVTPDGKLKTEPASGGATEASLATVATNTAPGTKITAATIPTGGVGPMGWLSAIWYAITQGITANQGAGSLTPWQMLSSGALTDRSGTITTGGAAQNAMEVNAVRKFVRLKNPVTATEGLYYSLTGTASVASDYLPPGYEAVSRSFVPTSALSVYAATTGHAFVAEEG